MSLWRGMVAPVMPRAAERALFLGLLVVSAIPLLAFQYVPSQDGPAHVANAAVILNSGDTIFAEYYDVSFSQGTNLLGDLALAGMLPFLTPSLAEKMMALLLLVGLPLSLRWCLHQLNADAIWLSILAIPLSSGIFIYWGFYNFLLGVVLSFLTFGFWLKRMRPAQTHLGTWALFALLVALVYLAHPLPLLALFLMIAAAILDDSLEDVRRSNSGYARSTINRLFPVVLPAVISLAFLVAFGAGQSTKIGWDAASPVTQLYHLPLDLVLSLTSLELPFAILPSVALGLLGLLALIHARGSVWRRPGFPVAMILLALFYFLGPNRIGDGTLILSRVLLYLAIVTLFWLAVLWTPRWANVTAVVLVSAAIVGLTTVRIPVHAETDAVIREYLSGLDVVKPASTILPLWASALERGPEDRLRRARPLHVDGYLTATKDVVDLGHFTAQFSVSPIQFKSGYGMQELMNLPDLDTALRFGPDLIDLDEFERKSPGRIDYVWLWGRAEADADLLEEPRSQRMLQQLENDYELIYVSAPGGLLEVHAQKGSR